MLEFLRRLFAKNHTSRALADRLRGAGTFSVEVIVKPHDVHTLDLIWEVTSHQFEHRESSEGDYWEHATDAKLVSDSSNSHEPYAVAVEIAGRKVGYLSRADALKIHRRLNQLEYDRIDASCKAMVTGRPKWWVVKLDFVENLIDATEKGNGSNP